MLNVSTSPHVRCASSTATVMRDVMIALLPPLLFGVYVLGLRALLVILLSVAACVGSEYLYRRLMRLPSTVGDGSAVVTGLILAMGLPSSVPWWIPVMGGAFAIVIVKQLFGGIGQNIMNPALAARCFLLISFPALVGSGFPAVGDLFGSNALSSLWQRLTTVSVDAVATATPLAVLRGGGVPDLWQLFFGLHAGCIGETSAAAILLGAAYLLSRRVIRLRIPAVYVLSTVAFIALFRLGRGESVTAGYLLGQALSGGLLAGAVFMATDYATGPITPIGQIVYAALLGLLTAMLRIFGSMTEGVSYAILIGNMLSPLIERITWPRSFGVRRAPREKKGGAQG